VTDRLGIKRQFPESTRQPIGIKTLETAFLTVQNVISIDGGVHVQRGTGRIKRSSFRSTLRSRPSFLSQTKQEYVEMNGTLSIGMGMQESI
jgi:hypothetical protein